MPTRRRRGGSVPTRRRRNNACTANAVRRRRAPGSCACRRRSHMTTADLPKGWVCSAAGPDEKNRITPGQAPNGTPTRRRRTAQTLWRQLGANNRRCTKSGQHKVASQQSCQAEAVAAGHKYYQFHGGNMLCTTSAPCTSPTNTAGPWKIYQEPTQNLTKKPTKNPTKAQTLWPRRHTACAPATGGDVATTARD